MNINKSSAHWLVCWLHRYRMENDVRQDLYNAAEEWMAAIGKKRKFLGGERPNLADIVRVNIFKTNNRLPHTA